MILFFALFGAHQLYLAKHESTTIDEYPHIASGINYLSNYDMSINTEHPPLFKIAAAIIPIIHHVTLPDNIEHNQWTIGEMLLTKYYANVPLLWWARIGVVLLNLSLMVLAYKTLSYRYRRSIAAAVMVLFCLNPLVLSHSHYVTNDISAALVSFTFILMIMNRLDQKTESIKNSWVRLSGIIFLMIITKYSLLYILGFAYLFTLFSVFIGSDSNKSKSKKLLMDFNKALLLALVLVYFLFLFLTHKQSPELSQEIINSNAGMHNPLGQSLIRLLSGLKAPLLLPVLSLTSGFLFVIGRVAGGGATYLHLVSYQNGVKEYFPFVFLIKNTISFLVAIVFSILVVVRNRNKTKPLSLAAIFIISFVFMYAQSAILGSLNLGIRHLSPIILPICLFIALSLSSYPKIALILGAGALLEVLPFILIPMSFSNFIIGGANQTHYYVNDSNLDWGQSNIRLRKYLISHDKFKNTNIAFVLHGQYRNFQHYFCPDPTTDEIYCSLSIKGSGGENAPANIFHWKQAGIPNNTDYLIISTGVIVTDETKKKYAKLYQYPYEIFDGTVLIYKLR